MHPLQVIQHKHGYIPSNKFYHYVYVTGYSIWIHESCKCLEASSESAKKKLKENGSFRYFCTFIKLPGRLFVVRNAFDQMHKPQASQGHFCQPSVKSCHEQPKAQLKQLHLLCPVSLHHLRLQQDLQYCFAHLERSNFIKWKTLERLSLRITLNLQRQSKFNLKIELTSIQPIKILVQHISSHWCKNISWLLITKKKKIKEKSHIFCKVKYPLIWFIHLSLVYIPNSEIRLLPKHSITRVARMTSIIPFQQSS